MLSYAKSASSKNVLSVLLKPARPEDAQPSLTQAPQSKPSMYCLAVGTAVVHAFLARQTMVPGVISSRRSHWKTGTPMAETRHRTGWLVLPRRVWPLFAIRRFVGWMPELKTLLTRTGLPSLSSTWKSAAASLLGGRSTRSAIRALRPSGSGTRVSPVTQ
jgi:hypothetical protein